MTALTLNAVEWQRKLVEFFSQFDDFSGTSMTLDTRQSFDDVLHFDIAHFTGDITSELTSELSAAFAGLASISFQPDMQSSRRKLVTVTVRRPDGRVLQALRQIWRQQNAVLSVRAWPAWQIALFLASSALVLGHASLLLHNHLAANEEPFSVLAHFVLHRLAKLWLFASAVQ